MLQSTLGLSYQQTYRVLNGYASRGATHSGLLEKCPAVSYFDTMVTEDGEGYAVRRREHLFSFDRAAYRRWAFGGGVWIDGGGERDDGPGPSDSFSISAGLQQDFSTGREGEKDGDGSGSHSTSTDRETRLSLSTLLQQSTHPDTGAGAGAGVCGCDRQNGESDPTISEECGERRERAASCGSLNFAACRKVLKDGGGADRVLQESLPGVLEHTEFSRVSTDLGRCTVCGEGRAVFRSADGRTRLCEACYARLVRAWNEGRGIA